MRAWAYSYNIVRNPKHGEFWGRLSREAKPGRVLLKQSSASGLPKDVSGSCNVA